MGDSIIYLQFMATETKTMTSQTITEACRAHLPRFAANAAVLTRTIPREVRIALVDRGLIHDHDLPGFHAGGACAQGYIADPRTFDA